MPVVGTLGGSIKSYFDTVMVPGGPPITENVSAFVDTFIPGSPPILEGTTRGDIISGFADEFGPSPPPIREGFTDSLHTIIQLFQQEGPGLGDSWLV